MAVSSIYESGNSQVALAHLRFEIMHLTIVQKTFSEIEEVPRQPYKYRLSGLQPSATRISVHDITAEDVIIVLLGPSGSGKSTVRFIDVVTGSTLDIDVGNGLQPTTKKIEIFRLSFPDVSDSDFIFIDTPGFDDIHLSDSQAIQMLSELLRPSAKSKRRKETLYLSGVLSFYDISNKQSSWTILKHLQKFKELFGHTKDYFNNISVVTTMWDLEDDDASIRSEEVEKNLKARHAHTQSSDGQSNVVRFLGTRESALEALRPFIQTSNKRYSILLEMEMAAVHAQFCMTGRQKAMSLNFTALAEMRRGALQAIRAELHPPRSSSEAVQPKQQEWNNKMLSRHVMYYNQIGEKLQLAFESMRTAIPSFTPGARLSKLMEVNPGFKCLLEFPTPTSTPTSEIAIAIPHVPGPLARSALHQASRGDERPAYEAADYKLLLVFAPILKGAFEVASATPMPFFRPAIATLIRIVQGINDLQAVESSVFEVAHRASYLVAKVAERAIREKEIDPIASTVIKDFKETLEEVYEIIKFLFAESKMNRFGLREPHVSTVNYAITKIIRACQLLGIECTALDHQSIYQVMVMVTDIQSVVEKQVSQLHRQLLTMSQQPYPTRFEGSKSKLHDSRELLTLEHDSSW
ncbi:hypothetical protein CVT24_000984 [Panaeolus cyanescens]|uniref:G domain-containing protein n=1 Tax=Panaeolus cyanescens TaxID=181874 RepID=A0A409YCF8_9AGAR|nr:hypothetical protein CVT24_000984 [Panaeolus cyanescens]